MTNNDKAVMVSIVCTTYNHAEYIRDALEGFVKQKTNFSYEIIVHDDASTDGTAEIIRQYAEKYPELFKPILQKENQHSQGILFSKLYILPQVSGKYIAQCEGDDYWTDENKLQKQVDFLEDHPEYAGCVHDSIILNCQSGKRTKYSFIDRSRDIEISDPLFHWGRVSATCSIMYRAEHFIVPDEIRTKGFNDINRMLYLLSRGKVFFMPDNMSVYRRMANGSWTQKFYTSGDTQKKALDNIDKQIDLFQRYDKFTNNRYHKEIRKAIKNKQIDKLLMCDRYRELIFGKAPDFIASKGFTNYLRTVRKAALRHIDHSK